jgi:hypothetical protein
MQVNKLKRKLVFNRKCPYIEKAKAIQKEKGLPVTLFTDTPQHCLFRQVVIDSEGNELRKRVPTNKTRNLVSEVPSGTILILPLGVEATSASHCMTYVTVIWYLNSMQPYIFEQGVPPIMVDEIEIGGAPEVNIFPVAPLMSTESPGPGAPSPDVHEEKTGPLDP